MTNSVLTVAEQAATAVHELAHLTRPGITALDAEQLYLTTGVLVDLVAALPQTLRQLQTYLTVGDEPSDAATMADPPRGRLHQASTTAANLAATLDAAHQALGDLAETTKTNARGSTFNRR